MTDPTDPLARRAHERPDSPAVSGPGSSWSYRRLHAEAQGVGRAVAGTGAGPGDAVVVHLPRGLRAVAAIHGIPRSGAALSLLHPDWTGRERRRYLERLSPAAVVCGPETTREAASAAPDAERVVLERSRKGGSVVRGSVESGASELPGPPGEGSLHSLVATSGTTAGPRAVELTLGNHLASARGARDRLDLRPEDRWYAALSLAHVGGLAMVIRAAVVGSSLVLRPAFDAGELARLLEAGEVTHASLVPVMLRRLLEAREDRPAPGELRCLLVGGAAAPPALIRAAVDRDYPVALTYGLTEASSQVATAPPALVREKPACVGPPLPEVEVRVGEDEEIRVRGPTVARGVMGGELPVDAEGWLHTGDAGRLDADGHLHVTGRLSGRIVTGGVTVDPAEVEATLAAHPVVRECAVVGVPDDEWGERVAAAVVPSEVAPEDEDRLRQSLEEYSEESLSPARRPRIWSFVEALPRNANGKPDRESIRRAVDRPAES